MPQSTFKVFLCGSSLGNQSPIASNNQSPTSSNNQSPTSSNNQSPTSSNNQSQPHLTTNHQPHLTTNHQPHLITNHQPHLITNHQPHLTTNLIQQDLCRIRQLRHCLDKDDRQRLVSARVLSRIDYCNVALVGLPAISLAPLQRVISAAARFVANLRPRDHVSHVLRDLHWLPICEPHDVQRRQWNSADIHDWHGHAHLRSPRSVSSPFCGRGTV